MAEDHYRGFRILMLALTLLCTVVAIGAFVLLIL